MAKGMVILEVDRCKGCAICVESCPTGTLGMSTDTFNAKGYRPVAVVKPEECTGCGICAIVCPDVVFAVYKQARAARGAA